MALENNQIENSNIDNDEISLKELIIKIKEWLSFLKTKWKSIFIVSIAGGLLGLSIAIFEKPTFKAVLTFAMEDDRGSGSSSGGLSGALGLASSFGIDLAGGGGGAFALNNLSELIKSRLIIEKVLLNPIQIEGKKTSLAQYYIQIHNLRSKWADNLNLKNIEFLPGQDRTKFSRQQDSILLVIHSDLINEDKLSITQKDKKVTILSIEVISFDEIFSKLFCEALATETSEFYITSKSKKARINVEILQRQVDSVRATLNGAIVSVASEVDNVYNLNQAYLLKGTESKKRQVDVQTNTAILSNLLVQLQLAKITLRKETPLIQLIDNPIFPLEKNKFGKKKSLMLGVFLSGFIFILFLVLLRLFKSIKV
jgi:hypothetical protein